MSVLRAPGSYLAVDQDGVIVGQELPDASFDDGSVGVDLMNRVPGKIRKVIGDGAYDSHALYDVAASCGARAVVPLIKAAQVRCNGSRARDRVVRRVRKVDCRRWKTEAGYHQQARAENAFFRYKAIFGDRMRAGDTDAQVVEARLARNILSRITELGMPSSHPVRM